MPRKPRRPTPQITDFVPLRDRLLSQISLVPSVYGKFDIAVSFLGGLTAGLLARLKRVKPKDAAVEWLSAPLETRITEFIGVAQQKGLDEARAWLGVQVALCRRRRTNARGCDPLGLLDDYHLLVSALEKASPLRRRYRNEAAKLVALREVTKNLIAALAAPLTFQERPIPRLTLCGHAYRESFPKDFETKKFTLRTERALIRYVLAYVHHIPGEARVMHLLDEGAKMLREMRKYQLEPPAK